MDYNIPYGYRVTISEQKPKIFKNKADPALDTAIEYALSKVYASPSTIKKLRARLKSKCAFGYSYRDLWVDLEPYPPIRFVADLSPLF